MGRGCQPHLAVRQKAPAFTTSLFRQSNRILGLSSRDPRALPGYRNRILGLSARAAVVRRPPDYGAPSGVLGRDGALAKSGLTRPTGLPEELLRGNHGRRLADSLDTLFPGFVSAENFNFHPEIIDG